MIPISKPLIGEAEKQAVIDVLESGMLVQGRKVTELEEKFIECCQVSYAVAIISGTVALHLALLAHGIGSGDEVITSPFTFIASVNSILYVQATPVLVDIEEDTFNLNPELIEAKITPNIKAIMPVHLFGYPCEMDTIMDIVQRHNLLVIEDAAQAIGARYKRQMIGSFGTGCFSLYATKNVMSGEGGIITTNDEVLTHKLRLLRNHGMERRYSHDVLGYNFRLSDLHAAIGCIQMDRLAEFTQQRRKNAAYLSTHIETLITPNVKEGFDHVWHQYTVRVPEELDFSRDEAIAQLTEAGIGTGIFYPVPVHKQAYLQNTLGEVKLPVAEKMAQQVFSLPVHPQLSQDDLAHIVETVNKLG